MATATVSSKYQVVIPKEVRREVSIRSGQVVQHLEKNHGFDNLYNLKGGILAWSDQIDPTVTKY